MLLYVFDKNLNRIAHISAYSFAQYEMELRGHGSFEVRMYLDDLARSVFQYGKFILFEKDVAGIITYFAPKTDEDTNNHELTIKGYMVSFLLSLRSTSRVTNFKGMTTTEAVRSLVNTHCIEPTLEARELPIVLSSSSIYNPADDDEDITTQVAGGCIDTCIEKLLERKDMGYSMAPILSSTSLSGFEFRVILGVDRTIGNSGNNGTIVFSTELKNVLSSEYVYNSVDDKNYAIVAGEGEGSNRTIIEVGDNTLSGLDRKETYVDAKDLQSTDEEGNTMTAEEYEEALINRGNSKLSEASAEESYSASLNLYSDQFIYGTDYSIGDFVSVIDRSIGIEINAQVTKVTASSLGEKTMFDVVLGNYKLSTAKKLKLEGVI